MATYEELVKQANELKEKADELLREEKTQALKTIKELVERYHISPTELAGAYSRKARKLERGPYERAATTPKYQGPDGKTWTGMGRAPGWFNDALASGKTKDDLLIRS